MYSFMVRINSIVAVAPLLWFALYRIYSKPKMCLLYSAGIIVVMFGFLNFFNYTILKAKKDNMQTYMMMDDLTYLSDKHEKSLIPKIKLDLIKHCAQEIIAENKLVGRLFCYNKSEEYKKKYPYNYKDLENAWINAIKTYPFEYSKFRLMSFSYLLRNPNVKPYNFFYTGHFGKKENLNFFQRTLVTSLEYYIRISEKISPFFFKPYFWLLLSIIGLLLTLSSKVDKEKIIFTRILFISGAFYTLGYLPVTPTADLRYTYWSTIAVTLGIVKLIYSDRLFRRKKLIE